MAERSRILFFFIYHASHFKQSLIKIIESHLTTGFRPASTTPPLHLSSVYTVLWLKLFAVHTQTLETFQLRSSYFIYFHVHSVAQKVQNNQKGFSITPNQLHMNMHQTKQISALNTSVSKQPAMQHRAKCIYQCRQQESLEQHRAKCIYQCRQ